MRRTLTERYFSIKPNAELTLWDGIRTTLLQTSRVQIVATDTTTDTFTYLSVTERGKLYNNAQKYRSIAIIQHTSSSFNDVTSTSHLRHIQLASSQNVTILPQQNAIILSGRVIITVLFAHLSVTYLFYRSTRCYRPNVGSLSSQTGPAAGATPHFSLLCFPAPKATTVSKSSQQLHRLLAYPVFKY